MSTSPRIHRAATLGFALLLILAFTAVALAQSPRTIGTVEGNLDGEAWTWYALDFGGPGEVEPTAYFSDFGFGLLQISIVANPEQRFMVQGALSIDIAVMGGLDCPCVFDDAEVVWWSTSSMFNEVFVSDEPGWARVTITRWEPVGEGVYVLEGQVEAELVFIERLGSEPNADRVRRLDATFRIDELPEEIF